MPHHKPHERIEQLKEKIIESENLTEEEKSNAIAHIKEWYKEDKASGLFLEEIKEKLLKISKNIEPILAELGFL